mmetsp:Transcript_81712/g.157790  ORF Transcript_81712/g.157790 Transcript_81712/m.157790 type:complete len:357 (-) Transcript_81712:199-1269(-)
MILAAGGCCFLVLALITLALSLGYVEPNEYGLTYNWITKQIGSDVYHGGTHLIGPWNTFVDFPATVQTIEFSSRQHGLATSPMLHTRTKEGLGLYLSIAFQYKLDPAKLPQLFALTNVRYESLYTRIARDQLLEAASEYEGPQYWVQRQEVGNQMRDRIQQHLKEAYADVWGLQLLVIDLPDVYEKKITSTQVQQQKINTRRNEQKATSIRADTEVLKAEFDRKIQVVRAGAEANYTIATRLAAAEATGRKIKAEGDALKYLRRHLNLSADGAVKFQALTAYGGLNNATFVANVANARINIHAPSSFLQQGSQHHKTPPLGALHSISNNNNSNEEPASDSHRRNRAFFLGRSHETS